MWIRKTLGRLTGRDGPLPDDNYDMDSSITGESQEPPGPSRFYPGSLTDFIQAANEGMSIIGTGTVPQWLGYWAAQGQHVEALDDFHKLVKDNGVRYEFREALDVAFNISRKREGRSKAYAWLVRAMVLRRGWGCWWSSGERFQARVHAIAKDYPEKWREFVIETSQCEPLGSLEDNGIIVGLSRLVYFLVEIGENELVKRCTMEMVEIFRDEVSQQPLVIPEWAR